MTFAPVRTLFTFLLISVLLVSNCEIDDEDVVMNSGQLIYLSRTIELNSIYMFDYATYNENITGDRADDFQINLLSEGIEIDCTTQCSIGNGDGVNFTFNRVNRESDISGLYDYVESSDEDRDIHDFFVIFDETGDGMCNTILGEVSLPTQASIRIVSFSEEFVELEFQFVDLEGNEGSGSYRGSYKLFSE